MTLEGQQLRRYHLQRLLGKGAMGEVYLAEDTGIGRQVAIKVIRSDVALEPGTDAAQDAVRDFQQEMRIIARLNHPYILPMFDYGDEVVNDITLPYMVMPFGADGSLATWLKQRGNSPLLSPGDVAHFVSQAAEALQYAHNQQIIHRDVKPSNFIIRINQNHPQRPDLLLADFGLARLISTSSHTTLTIGGTPPYMAPEQWEGYPVPATDQYMLAAMAYELLAGRPPFQGTLPQLIYQHIQNQPEPCSSFNSQVSSQLDTVIARGLAKRPEDRFPDIATFSRNFQDAVQKAGPNTDDSFATLDSSRLTPVAVPVSHADLPSSQPALTLSPPDRQDHATSSVKDQQTLANTSNANHGLNLSLAASKQGLRCSVVLLFGLVLLVIGSSTIYFSLNSHNRGTLSSAPDIQPTANAQAAATSIAAQATPLATAQANATATGITDPYPPYAGALVLNDPLRDNSQGYGWPTYQDSLSSCEFSAGAYHVTENKAGFYADCFSDPYFSDFTFQVQMQIIQGDCGGIMFRSDPTHTQFYYFRICQDGSYTLFLYRDDKNADAQTLTRGTSLAFHAGLFQTNIIAVVANGSQLSLYTNQALIVSIIDSHYTNGHTGVAAEDIGNQTEVVYSNAKVWSL